MRRHSATVDVEDLDVDELKKELGRMKEILRRNLHVIDDSKKKKKYCGSVIDGNIMSTIFLVTFVVIVLVAIFSFRNLYVAVMKKYPNHHVEL